MAINSPLVDCFKGGRGLRQGDPFLPNLFVIAMEVFLKMMGRLAGTKDRFKYHSRCDKVALSRLCFADDLMRFAIAKEGSIQSFRMLLFSSN